MREMQQPEIHHDRIEAGIRKRQRLRVGFPKLDAGVFGARELQHRGGKVDADRGRAARVGGGGRVPGTGRDVEHPHRT